MRWLKNVFLGLLILSVTQVQGLFTQISPFKPKLFHIKNIPSGRLSRIIYLPTGQAVYLRSQLSQETYLGIVENSHFSEHWLGSIDFNLQKDRQGDVWLAGITNETSFPQLILEKIEQSPSLRLSLTHSTQQIYPSSLDFAFDLANQAVFVWLEKSSAQFSLQGYQTATATFWKINHPSLNSASFPRILIDQSNRIWVFWVGNLQGNDDIFVTCFDNGHWTPVKCLSEPNPYPDLFPQIKEGPDGQIWLVWSGYDGHDYEIFGRRFQAGKWSNTQKITDNSTADSAPFLLLIRNKPLIFWLQAKDTFSFLRASFWPKQSKINPVILFQSIHPFHKIQAALQDGQISLVLQGFKKNTLLTTTVERLFSVAEHHLQESPEQKTSPVVKPELDDNSFIGFGNSITYGYIDYHEAPEIGYIPRLEAMLIQQYGEGHVINEGWPGETTVNGVTRIEEVLDKHQAQYLLLMEGTNDIIFQEISTDTSEFNLKEMVRKSREYGVYVIITTIIPRNDWRWKRNYYRERIYALNDRIRNLAVQEKVPFIDFFNIFYNYPEEDGGWTTLLSTDKVHPSEKGYQLMAESWFGEIKLIPFPPQEIQVYRIRDGFVPVPHTANVIIWQLNKKLDDLSNFLYINIYRREKVNSNYHFELIHRLPLDSMEISKTGLIGFPSLNNFGPQFVDRTISNQKKYEYVLSLIRKDEIEGPPSSISQEHVVIINSKKKKFPPHYLRKIK